MTPRHRISNLFLATALLPITSIFAQSNDQLSFNEHVRPILAAHCVECHGGVKQAGDLSFVYEDQAAAVIEPGLPEDSTMLDRISSDDPSELMPPPEHGARLSEDEVATLRKWIEQGAKWGRHWAFDKPKISTITQDKNDDWSRERVDHFTFRKLMSANLKPSVEASPERWLRRTTLDLIGLPPTPREVKAFTKNVAAEGESAYRIAVDTLLENPAFGERWASVWLDSVRYADSRGLGLDGRRTIWKYRDWVIRAFNDDMPYDEFTIKQIAGDLIPDRDMDDLLATACNRLTQTCEEGGTDDEQFRIEAVMDRVNTTMLAWQGLTIGCVQCHSHPYEPIQHDEYYKLLAFFNNSADCDLGDESPNLAVPLDDEQMDAALELDDKISALEEEEWSTGFDLVQHADWTWPEALKAKTNNATKVVTLLDGLNNGPEYRTEGNVAKETTIILEAEIPEKTKLLTAVKFTGIPENLERAIADSEWGFVLSHIKVEVLSADKPPVELDFATVIADEPDPLLDPLASLNAKSSSGFSAFTRIYQPRQAAFVLKQPFQIAAEHTLRISLKQNSVALGAFPLVTHRGQIAFSGDEKFSNWLNSDTRTARLAAKAKLQSTRAAIKSVKIPIMRERPQTLARKSFVFDRGNFLTKTDAVEPTTPAFLNGEQQAFNNRLELAQWIASSENPLTARVAVNRVWSQLFGNGLVATQEDFGSTGSPPSHPELLDDLATRFSTEMRWSTKTLLRELVLSSTYRQKASATPELLERDPDNRLLARGPRHRLPAEVIRDQALSVSGLLTNKLYGPPVHPPIPSGVWLPFQGGDKWTTPEKGDPDRYRRTIYAYVKRTIQFPMLASFDVPTREFCAPRRLASNTPLQALMTLNDTTFVEAAEALAQRMLEHSDAPRRQIRFGVKLVTCRTPSNKEVKELTTLLESQKSEESQDAQLAALTAVATVLLNLDEVLCK